MKRLGLLLSLCPLPLLLATYARGAALTETLPHIQGTRRIVLEQLETLLSANPQLRVIGLGSWMRSGAQVASKAGGISRVYSDPLLGGTSDTDLKLVMEGEENAVAKQWKALQENLRKGIQRLFPNGADPKAIEKTLLRFGFGAEEAASISRLGPEKIVEKILTTTNVYSPTQLIRHVVDEKTAAATFKRLGTVPNLGGRIVEGVWGEGAAAAVQEFEAGGRLFYTSGNGALRTGFVDLVHMAEGYGRYTLGGAANMSAQWAQKAAEAIAEGDPALVAKYLKRL